MIYKKSFVTFNLVEFWLIFAQFIEGLFVSCKNLEEKDGQRQLLYYVSLIRACNKVQYQLVYIGKKVGTVVFRFKYVQFKDVFSI